MSKIINPVPSHPDYSVTVDGAIYNMRTRRCVYNPDTNTAYNPRIRLDGERCYVANVVAETYLPIHPKGYQIFHIDGNLTNNSVDNLIWMSHSNIQKWSKYDLDYRRHVLMGHDIYHD